MSFSISSMPLLALSLLVIGTLRYAACAGFPNTSCIEAEREALLKFKQGLVDSSGRLSSWTGDDCCSWMGVGCSKTTGHVSTLDLRSPCVMSDIHYDLMIDPVLEYGDCSLTGKVHPSLIELRHLTYLDLSWNNFSHTEIPAFLGSLRDLVYLNLSNACFTGKVPLHLGNLSNLQYLDLNTILGYDYSSSAVTVDNLEWLSNLSFLKHLDLSGVTVRNGQGWLQSVGMLPSLQHLGLAACFLPNVAPTVHVNFTSLEFLDLSDNALGSTVPFWLLNLTSIRHLDLSSSFQGDLFFPAEIINNNKQLAFLHLYNNPMQGELPKNLSSLCDLFALRLSFNYFTGDIATILANPSSCFQDKLRFLDLGWNNFSGNLGNEIEHFKSLEYIDLASNSIEGPIPESLVQLSSLNIPISLCKMKDLFALDLSNNQLSGTLPDCWKSLGQLDGINLGNNNLSGQIPTSLCSPPLTFLGLPDNDFHGILPRCLSNMTSLRVLDLSRNEFSGRIPSWIGQMFQLSVLNLESNTFNGEIPREICQLANVRVLSLAQNKLSGVIPLCFDNLTILADPKSAIFGFYGFGVEVNTKSITQLYTTTLQYLFSVDLSNNGLNGHIVGGLMQLYNLQNLNLSGNNFEGRIPSEIANLKMLESLDLSVNQFSGPIPQSLSELNFLSYLNLSFNQLSGRIPSGAQLSTLKGDSYLGNDGLCGPPLSKNCPGDHEQPDIHKQIDDDSESEDEFYTRWLYAGIAPGFATGFLVVCGSLYFKRSWRQSFFRCNKNDVQSEEMVSCGRNSDPWKIPATAQWDNHHDVILFKVFCISEQVGASLVFY
ncbi:hypothetical protein CRG98_027179 [Punica granatum]|uniref:Leucine-rich repeat-containing N-terminal plant-type domain-containing protein n=1 Tax=Punica granatum TaxID=22663 RepID=A0A2I0J9S0_PUNGR|nr:hypothetical protein CRG98_027179 [Punica granatum]